MPRRVIDRATGQVVWIDDKGNTLGFDPGMGSLPGQAERREADLYSRLPDAQIAGYRGPSVVNPQPMRGARPNDPDPQPLHTYRPLAGAKQNNRGQAKVITLPATLAPIVVEAGSIIETPRNGGDDAENITVVCGYQPQGVLSTSAFDIKGIIEFGIGGASFEAEFDWLNGTCFAIPASFVRVKAEVSYGSLLTPIEMALSAGLAYGYKGGSLSAHMKRSFRPDGNTLAPGDSFTGFIPNFATGVSVVHGSLTGRSTLALSGTTNVQYDTSSMANTANQRDGMYPIPSGCNQFTLTNTGVANLEPNVVFTIAL